MNLMACTSSTDIYQSWPNSLFIAIRHRLCDTCIVTSHFLPHGNYSAITVTLVHHHSSSLAPSRNLVPRFSERLIHVDKLQYHRSLVTGTCWVRHCISMTLNLVIFSLHAYSTSVCMQHTSVLTPPPATPPTERRLQYWQWY